MGLGEWAAAEWRAPTFSALVETRDPSSKLSPKTHKHLQGITNFQQAHISGEGAGFGIPNDFPVLCSHI